MLQQKEKKNSNQTLNHQATNDFVTEKERKDENYAETVGGRVKGPLKLWRIMS